MSDASELTALLDVAKSAALLAANRLLDSVAVDRSYVHTDHLPREVKAAADLVLEQDILQSLAGTQLAVLSEESGYIPASRPSNLWFIVDPLDGTFNFIKGLGPCGVSIALWEDDRPVFGVIYNLVGRQLAWGGARLGAFVDGRPITVSQTSSLAQASICTGFPVRFDMDSEQDLRAFCMRIRPYAKVRMIGSAALALLHVAQGSADVYLEQDIMLWDVAAGVAIVEGAGGEAVVSPTGRERCHDVIASNPALMSLARGQDRPQT